MENPLLRTSAPRGQMQDDDPIGLRSLAGMSSEELRAEWRRLYRVPPPPRVRRELLLLGIAWKRQERALGGLGAAVQRRLAELAGADRPGDANRRREMWKSPSAGSSPTRAR